MDLVTVEHLKVTASIGVWEWEQRIKQNLTIDLELGTDIRKAAETDDLENAVSYKDVSRRITEYVTGTSHRLIETVAENIAQIILTEFPVTWCRVKVSKPRAVENSRNVAIIIERGERQQ